MHRFNGGLLLVVCASLTSAAALGHVRIPSEVPAAAEAGSVSVDGVRGRPSRSRPSWADDHVMVAPREESGLEALAVELGAVVTRAIGPAGWGGLSIPPGMTRAGLLARLRADPRVRDALPDGLTYGTSDIAAPAALPTRRGRARWHMVASNPPDDGAARGVTVALLDTGVAYEDHVDGAVRYRQVPSLSGVRFVHPWDFINGDAHPNDDHQHGTHLASLVAADGAYPGMAPGVSIMPVKVLDAENVGTELALVDGIVHATRHGADVINMSLSFGRGYVPSRALVEALEAASRAGIVLVAAAGNDGGDYVSQPAANPLVIAVGANRPEGGGVYGAAPYSNASPRVDLMAPGGSVDRDRDGDGLLDGVIGETIALGDPTRTGYWLYAGTSQATALVSGASAQLLAAGFAPGAVRVLLQGSAATEPYIRTFWLDGRGRGRLDVTAALELGHAAHAPVARALSVALLAWLTPDEEGDVRPAARITALDEALLPMVGVEVVGTFSGVSDVPFVCVTGADGACTVYGPTASLTSAPAWTVSADDVVLDGVSHHPRTALFGSEGLRALVDEMGTNAALAGAVPVWRWRAQDHPILGPVADGILIGNHGTGIATSPQVFVATAMALGRSAVLESGSIELTGSAVSSHPAAVRALSAPRCDAGPTGYEVLQLGAADMTALVLDATGLGEGPLALGAPELMAGMNPASRPFELSPFVVERPCAEAEGNMTPFLDRGGWTAPGGEPAASALAASLDIWMPHVRLSGSESDQH